MTTGTLAVHKHTRVRNNSDEKHKNAFLRNKNDSIKS